MVNIAYVWAMWLYAYLQTHVRLQSHWQKYLSVCPTALGSLVPREAHLGPVNLLARTEAHLGLVEVAGCLAESNKGEVACDSLCIPVSCSCG